MSLEQLGKEAQAFIKESLETAESFVKYKDDLQQKVNKGLRGSVEVQQELANMEANINSNFKEKVTKLQEKMQTIKEDEIKIVEESEEPITSDALAELTLLSQLDLTNEDMARYTEKYKKSPLALKKLREIAQEKKLFGEFPEDRKERLNITLGRMDNNLLRAKTPRMNDEHDLIKVRMIAEGAIRGIEEDVSYYRSL